jgi:hypothetical protein
VRRPEPRDIERCTYLRAATALWRWVDAPQDAELAAFLAEYAEYAGVADPAPVRARQTERSCYTLITYARRCVLRALRTGDPAAALSAFEALSVVEMDRVDPRDLAVAASLVSYGARRVELDPRLVLDGPARRAEPAVADLLHGAATGAAGSGGYHELRTRTGPVLISAGGPVAGAVALLKTALAIAAAVEDDGRYGVTTVATELNLPAVWLAETPPVAAARRTLKRVVSIMADPPDSGAHFLLTFLVEADTEDNATTIAEGVRRDREGAVLLAVAAGKRVAVVIARSAVLGVPPIEDDRSLARLTEPVTAALTG